MAGATGFDVIVLGCGGVGSAALYHLADRGLRVLGIDRFAPGHDRGSSHGETRAIRQAYFEHPDYVPLLRRAWTLWRELEGHAGGELLVETGVLQFGPADGEVVPGVLHAARQHGLDVERLSSAEVARRYPGIVVPDTHQAVFEARGGYLRVEDCVQAHVALARARGASLLAGTAVTGWRPDGEGVSVDTGEGTFRADRLVVCAGAWAGQLLPGLGVPLTVLRKHLHWFGNRDPRYRQDHGFPVFLFELPQGIYYGFPQVDGSGVKFCEHSGGEPLADPMARSEALDAQEFARVEAVLRRQLPGVDGPALRHAACMYTMTPDAHFLVDRHPAHPQVWLAAGLSGHGFKFAPVLGELLADLAVDGDSRLPWRFLSRARFD